MRQIYFFLLAAAMMIPDVVNAQAATRELTNLVVFVRFADDEEIDHSFYAIDSMFNSREPGYYSVYNYYDAMSYGRIHYNTVYTAIFFNASLKRAVFITLFPSSEKATAPASFMALKSTGVSFPSPMVMADSCSILTGASFAFSCIYLRVSTESTVGLVFGMVHTVVTPPAAAAAAPESISSL